MPNTPLQFGQYYHIFNRGNNRQTIFAQARNYPYFLKLYAKHIEPVAETFAYCLLPNHFHVAIRTYTEAEQTARVIKSLRFDNSKTIPYPPSLAFKNLFIAYSRAFNRATERTGALFERPFKRKVIDSEAYFMALIRYIHRNPQNHKLVKDFRQWDWSSYHTLLSSKPTKLQREAVFSWYNNQKHFITAHRQELDQNIIQALVDDDWH